MKKIKYFLVFLAACTACTDDVLDKKPLDVITDADVWRSPALITTYINGIYADMPILYADNELYYPDKNPAFVTEALELADEGSPNWDDHLVPKYGNMTTSSNFLSWWGYGVIRKMNELINRLPDVTDPAVNDEYKTKKLAEVRFLRAFAYFHLVKLFGGVPLITKAQRLDDPEEELYPVREKEETIYDFILSELDAISNDLPESYPDSEFGRPTRFAALALRSRAAIYAASIAQWGTVKLDGIVGISSSKANTYWQIAYDASKAVIDYSATNSGSLALFNKYPNKTQNYRQIFLEQRNVEVIWARSFMGEPGASKGPMNLWNLAQSPRNLHPWVGGQDCAVYLEMVDEYENKDGSSGKLDRAAITSGMYTINELFGQKEPRFIASIYTENTNFYGNPVRMYNGIIDETGTLLTSGTYKELKVYPNGRGQSGFGVLKYCTGSEWPQNTDWILIRYAEVLLNNAEAAFELGKTAEALAAVNQIRARVDLPALTSINRDQIRHERKVELAFESHRYWDLRRWRTATTDLTKDFTYLQYTLDYTSYKNDPTNAKYKLKVLPADNGRHPVFYEKNYYFPITPGRISNNSNLIENPDYN